MIRPFIIKLDAVVYTYPWLLYQQKIISNFIPFRLLEDWMCSKANHKEEIVENEKVGNYKDENVENDKDKKVKYEEENFENQKQRVENDKEEDVENIEEDNVEN